MRIRNKELIASLTSVFFGILAGGFFMALSGSNPFVGYFYFFAGSLMNIERLGNTLAITTPLILTGLSVAFAFRAGLFNIGASGQILIGGLISTAIGLTLPLPKPLLLPILLFAAVIGGGLWGGLSGWLKAKFNVHEVVSTIMLNWTSYWIVYYTIPAFFRGTYETESLPIPDNASLKLHALTELFQGSYINLGLVVAVLAVVLVSIVLKNTVLGYQLQAVGFNRHAAEYGGINVNLSMSLAMAISGALAGLAGATFYLGYTNSMQIGVMPTIGFDGIAVALLAANHSVGIVGSAFFFGVLQTGKGFMNAMTHIPIEIGDTIIAVIIYFSATSILIERLWDHVRKKRRDAKLC